MTWQAFPVVFVRNAILGRKVFAVERHHYWSGRNFAIVVAWWRDAEDILAADEGPSDFILSKAAPKGRRIKKIRTSEDDRSSPES